MHCSSFREFFFFSFFLKISLTIPLCELHIASVASLVASLNTMLQMGNKILCIQLSLAKTLYLPLCIVLFMDGLQLQPSSPPALLLLLICFQFGNVGSVVKSALMRCCDVVSWYVAIPGVIYPCASLSLFSWFEFKIKQAVTCAECVCQSRSPPRLFSAHTASNVGPRQSIVKESDGFFAPCYVIEMYILGFKPRC